MIGQLLTVLLVGSPPFHREISRKISDSNINLRGVSSLLGELLSKLRSPDCVQALSREISRFSRKPGPTGWISLEARTCLGVSTTWGL